MHFLRGPRDAGLCLPALLLPGQGLVQAHEILRSYMNEAATRTVDVRYQKERDRYNQRQNKQQSGSCSRATHAIPDQQVAANGDRYH
jgi:L-2-hydroxyglutarate oxidase LhgO